MVRQSDMYDITIIGAGPVGLYAAYYAGLRDSRTKIIDTNPQVGGRLISMYPEKEIFDVAGHTRILARDLVTELTKQAMQYRPTVVLNERVTGLRIRGERVIELSTPKGRHYSQTVVISAGCGAFVPRKLDIPHLTDLGDTGSTTTSHPSNRCGERRSSSWGEGTARSTGRFLLSGSQRR